MQGLRFLGSIYEGLGFRLGVSRGPLLLQSDLCPTAVIAWGSLEGLGFI